MKALKRNTVTLAWLEKLGACNDHIELFAKTFGDSTAVTPEAITRAAAVGLDLDWIAERIITATALKAYKEAKAPAWKAYEEATAPALKAYEEGAATAFKAYEEGAATAFKAYVEAEATAWKAYKEATATALKSHKEAKATALIEIIFGG